MLSLAFALLVLQQPTYRTGPAAATPAQPAPAYQVAPGAGSAVRPAAAPPPELALTGVMIDAYDKGVEDRWGPDDPFYTGTVRGGAAVAQSRQGPLDGGWRLVGADGAVLYALQLVDPADGLALEGAWREAGAAAAGAVTPAKSGFIALMSREEGRAVFRFLEPGASAPTVVTLAPTLDGTWRGELTRASGPPAPVIMRR